SLDEILQLRLVARILDLIPDALLLTRRARRRWRPARRDHGELLAFRRSSWGSRAVRHEHSRAGPPQLVDLFASKMGIKPGGILVDVGFPGASGAIRRQVIGELLHQHEVVALALRVDHRRCLFRRGNEGDVSTAERAGDVRLLAVTGVLPYVV